MEKQLLDIEFRYSKVPKSEYDSDCGSRTVTIGIYDSLEEAVKEGNNVLNKLKKWFKFNNCFKVHGLFGNPDRLVTNCFSDQKVQFFAHIRKLEFLDIDNVIDEAFANSEKYSKWREET